MRELKDIISQKHLKLVKAEKDYGFGVIKVPAKKGKKECSVVYSVETHDENTTAEHVSISPYDGTTPTWDMMCFVKDVFWRDDEEVVQIHPPKKDYVNVKDNCLHLWKFIRKE